MRPVTNAQPGRNRRFRRRFVPARWLLGAFGAAAMTAWISLAWCQTGKPKSADDPNVIEPPPFYGDVPTLRIGKAGKGSARAGPAGPIAQAPPAEAPPVASPGAGSAQPWPADVLASRADRAIRVGLDYLYAAQKPDGSWETKYASQHPGGVEALVILAAIEAGEDVKRPQLVKALQYIDQLAPKTTYVRAVRAMVYSLLPGKDYEARRTEDVNWLIASINSRAGGWGYGPGYRTTRENPNWVDNSNTYLAMLALREADQAGAKVAPVVWARLRTYWARNANTDGGISYQPPVLSGFRLRGSSYGSMTAAGISALLILTDTYSQYVDQDYASAGARRSNPSPFQKAIDASQRWLAGNIALGENPKWVWGAGEAYEYYYLNTLVRAADESGMERLGAVDVARGAAEIICRRQKSAGCWTDPSPGPGAAEVDDMASIRTCFAVMALARARGALVIDKIAVGPHAGDDARDAANLAGWMSRNLGVNASWRQVSVGKPHAGYVPAPLLYVQVGDKTIPDALASNVRSVVDAGGTVIIQPFAARKDIVDAVKAWLKALLPDYTAGDVPADHVAYSLHFKLPEAARPKLFALGDTCRLRVFVLETDAGGAWHQSRWEAQPQLFELPANLLLYTTDLAAPQGRLAVRLGTPTLPATQRAVRIARVRHSGDWNVCKGAMTRLGAVLAESVSLGLDVGPAVEASARIDPNIPVLWMTGTIPARLSEVQKTELKAYLVGGGTLMIDSAMGTEPFVADARAALAGMFGPAALREIPADHPLLTGAFGGQIGCDLTKASYTRAANGGGSSSGGGKGQAGPSKLMMVEIAGRAAVVLSPTSVIAPLQGQPIYNCKGLAAPDAARLAANVVLYAVTR